MSKVFLIAETPRAGKWNHRYLVAEGNTLSERTIANFVSSARHEPIGKNYIAVKRDVSQEQSGRTGQEILVLVGVNTECISDNEKQKITTSLESCLTNGLDRLVTNTIEWNSIGTSMLVERPELNEWGKQFSRLPHIEIIETNSFEFTHQKISRVELTNMGKSNQLTHWFLELSWGVKLMIIVAIGLVGSLFFISLSPSPSNTGTQNDAPSSEQNATNALNGWIKEAGLDATVILDQTTSQLKSTTQQQDGNSKKEDNVLQNLNNIRGHNVESVSLDEINQWKKSWDEDKDNISLTMKLIPRNEDNNIKRHYLAAFTKESPLTEIVTERNFIRSFYKELKKSTPKECKEVELTQAAHPYLTFVCSCVLSNNCIVNEGDYNASLIFFSKHDVTRAEALVSFYNKGRGDKQSYPLSTKKKLSEYLCDLADREKNPKENLLQKSREAQRQDENIINNAYVPWTNSLKDFSKVFEQCPEPAAPTQKNTDTGKK